MIRLAEAAENDLQHIEGWVQGHFGRIVASRTIESILTTIELLENFPELGRPGRRQGTRELGIPRLPYIAVYRIVKSDIMIARVLHAAMQWPPENSP